MVRWGHLGKSTIVAAKSCKHESILFTQAPFSHEVIPLEDSTKNPVFSDGWEKVAQVDIEHPLGTDMR